MKQYGLTNQYYEIWNEPDFSMFSNFDKNPETYCEIYRFAYNGIREADKDAKIGGPSCAFGGYFLSTFIDFAKYDEKIKPNFISGHAYGDAKGMLEQLSYNFH